MPILYGSAFKNKGVQPMLDAVVDFLPSPIDLPPTQGTKPGKDEVIERKPSDDEPFAALAFKVQTDPYVGKLTYLRVYSGTLEKGDTVVNTTKGTQKERLGRLLLMHANNREDLDTIRTGDIVAAVGLKQVTTGDTPRRPTSRSSSRRSSFPSRSSTSPSSPRPRPTRTSSAGRCYSLSEEDPTFRVRTDEETGQTVISGMGELHLEVLVDRMLREFTVDANVGKPQVAYRETIRKTVDQGRGALRPPDRWPAASTATSSSPSSPRAPAGATSSSTRSPAASSPRSTSSRSTPGITRGAHLGRPGRATRSWTCACASPTARTTTSTPRRWPSRSPVRSR